MAVTIDRIIKYVTETPGNTNKAVLRSLLEDLVDEQDETVYYDGGDVNGYDEN